MRDDSVSVDDLRIAAAKEQLAALPSNPGYAAAIDPPVEDRGPARRACTIAAIACFALAVACAVEIGALWLRIALPILFVVVGAMLAMAAIGFMRERPDRSWAVVVLDRTLPHGETRASLRLLRDDGRVVTVDAMESVCQAVKPGDIGVARLPDSVVSLVTGFVRL